MNKKLLKLLAITACSLTFATTLSLGVASSLGALETAKAYEITFEEDATLQDEYVFGSSLTVPMGTIDGVKANKFMVIAPSGNGYNAETISLNEAGRYTVKWFATVGGKEVFAEKSFVVTKSVYSVEGKASCEYMEDLEIAQYVDGLDGFTREDVTTEGDGIKISIGDDGSSLKYNNVIDLKNFSNDPFIEFHPYQRYWNFWQAPSGSFCELEEDARNYLITLTDCYDPTNYVTIDIEWVGNTYYPTFRAGAVGQVAHGLTPKSDGSVNIAGESYSVAFEPSSASNGNSCMSQLGLKLFYDTQTQRIYATRPQFTCSKNIGVWHQRVLFSDLANKDIYPDNAFKGFTTGEVYLSLSARNILDGEANMDITSINGVKGKEMLDFVIDKTAPTIVLDENFETMKD
ncbi:MAG: hypothetical protein IKA72_01385, partial [Clostridia bacterium]|nr:hypothetical protein [Clostridia bacterium]